MSDLFWLLREVLPISVEMCGLTAKFTKLIIGQSFADEALMHAFRV